jgi:hypothetical protein
VVEVVEVSNPIVEPIDGEDPTSENVDTITTPLVEEVVGPIKRGRAERTARQAALIKGGASEGQIGSVTENLIQTNEDPTVSQILDEEESRASEKTTAKISGVIVSEASDEEKIEQIRNIKQEVEGRPKATMDSVFMKSMANITGDTPGKTVSQSYLASQNPTLWADPEATSLKRHELTFASEHFKDKSILSATTAFVGQGIVKAFVPAFTFQVNSAVNQSFRAAGLPSPDHIKPGDSIVALRKAIRDSDSATSKKLIEGAIEGFSSVTAWAGRDDVDAVGYITSALTNYQASDDQIENEAAFFNIISFIDLLPAGSAIGKKLIKAARSKWPNSVASQLERANAGEASREFREALQGIDPGTGSRSVNPSQPDNNAQQLGTTTDQILTDNVFPGTHLDETVPGPDMNRGILVDDRVDMELLYTTREIELKKTNIADDIDRQFQEINGLSDAEEPVVHLHRSKIEQSEDGSGLDVTYALSGNSSDYGDNSLRGALNAAGLFEDAVLEGKVGVKKLNPQTGQYDDIGEAVFSTERNGFELPNADLDEPGQFIAEIRTHKDYTTQDSLAVDDLNIGYGGSTSKYLNISSQWNEATRKAWTNMTLASGRTETQLKQILDPFFKLSGKAKGTATPRTARVLEILEQGSQDQQTYTSRQLFEMANGDSGVVTGVEAFYRLNKEIYRIADKSLIREMNGIGAKIVYGRDLEELATPIQPSTLRDVDEILDVESGLPLQVGKASDLEGKGTLVKFVTQQRAGERLFDYGIVKSTKVKPIPKKGLLREIAGWIPRRYNITHKLEVRTRSGIVNGKRKEFGEDEGWSTVNVSDDKGSLLRYQRHKQGSAKEGVEYRVVEARELADTDDVTAIYSMFRDTGQLVFSRRGSERFGVGGNRKLAGILESQEAAIGVASRTVGIDPFIKKSIASWEKRFNGVLGVEKIPLTGKIPRPRDVSKHDDWREAVAQRDLIARTAGLDRPAYDRLTKALTTSLGDMIVGEGNNTLRNFVGSYFHKRALGPSIPNSLKNLAFGVYLGLNPVRQALMQMQQATVYVNMDGGAKYIATGRAFRDWTNLNYYLGRRTLSKSAHDKALRKINEGGGDGKEIVRMADAWDRISTAVDSHVFMNTLSTDPRVAFASDLSGVVGTTATLAKKGATVGSNAVKKVVRASTALGFKAGEHAQLSTAFLFAKNRWQVRHPNIADQWDSRANLSTIISETQDVSFNPTFRMAHNDGVLGMFFQFTSHAQKAMQAVLPKEIFGVKTGFGKMSSDVFSKHEKQRLAVTQLLLYGAPLGAAVNSAWESFKKEQGIVVTDENNAKIREVLDQGILGAAVNHMTRWVDEEGEYSQVEFDTFGPFSGVAHQSPIVKIGQALFTSDQNVIETLLGAGGGVKGSAAQTLTDIAAILRLPELPEDQSKLLLATERAARFIPLFGNFYKANLEEGYLRSSQGKFTATKQGRGEAIVKALTGLQSVTEVHSREFTSDTFDEVHEMQEISKKFVNQLTRFGLEGNEFSDKEMRDFVTGSYFGFKMMGEVKGQALVNMIKEEMTRRPVGNDPYPAYTLWMSMVSRGKMLPSGDAGEDLRRFDASVFGGEENKNASIRFGKTHSEVNERLVEGIE